jgi:feruloyl-CoA synthase
MIFADLDTCCSLSTDLAPHLPVTEIAGHNAVRSHFSCLLEAFVREATGSSNRVTRAILLEEPPSLDAGEITDKGSLNQRAVLQRRAHLVEELYAQSPSPRVLRIKESSL